MNIIKAALLRRAEAYRAMAMAAMFADSSAATRLKRYRHHIGRARSLELLQSLTFSEPANSEELFISPDIRYVREALYQGARHGNLFCAVVGESGSGKSTVRKDLLALIACDRLPVVLIKPYVLSMEDNDIKGQTLKSAHICEAILEEIAPGAKPMRSSEARFRQVHMALRESARMGNRHMLIIEEAHNLPVPTLKHLKRFFDLEAENGFDKLLSIVLIGQPELAQRLDERSPEVREVVQRCELLTLNPLGEHLYGLLAPRFQVVGKQLDEMQGGAK